MAIKTSTHLYDVIDTNVNKKVADTTTVKKSTGSKVTWSQLQAPGTHIANITINGTQTQVYAPDPGSTVTWSQVLGSGTKIASININGTATDVYAPSATGAPAWGTITGTLSDQTDLQSALNGKAASSHTHTIANVTNLQTTLDGKAATSHTHTIANVTNLQSTLDGKAPTNHTHYSSVIGYGTDSNVGEALDELFETKLSSSDVTITPMYTTGNLVAKITIGGTTYDIYAPATAILG